MSDSEKDLKKGEPHFALGKENYKLLGIGCVVIALGYVLMCGHANSNPNGFDMDVFSFRRITLAPLVVLAGFAVSVYAVLKKPKE